MSDYVATTVDCDNGQASVTQMDSVFQAAPANIQTQFRQQHDAIMSTYNSTWYTGIDLIPFNPACGTMQQLGQEADALANQILQAQGLSPVAGPSTGSSLSLTTMLLIGAAVYLLFLNKGGSVVNVFSSRKRA